MHNSDIRIHGGRASVLCAIFLRSWVKSKFTLKIHPANSMAALWAMLLGLPQILAFTRRNVKIHLLYRLTSCCMEYTMGLSSDCKGFVGIMVYSCRRIFFLSLHSAVKWARTEPGVAVSLAVSLKGCQEGLHRLCTATLWMMLPEVVRSCCPFYFYLHRFPIQGRRWQQNS